MKAAPDGYTLSFGHNGSHVVNGAVYSLPYDLRTDFEPVALLPSNPLMISARKDFPAANLKELIAWLKANPGKAAHGECRRRPAAPTSTPSISRTSPAPASSSCRIKSVQTAIKALTTGELDLLFDQASNSLPHLRAGTIKAYAVTSKTRTVVRARRADHRRRRPAGILQRELVRAVGAQGHAEGCRGSRSIAPSSRRWPIRRSASGLSDQGLDMPPADQRTPEALGAFHRAEIDKWWPILKAAGIKAK